MSSPTHTKHHDEASETASEERLQNGVKELNLNEGMASTTKKGASAEEMPADGAVKDVPAGQDAALEYEAGDDPKLPVPQGEGVPSAMNDSTQEAPAPSSVAPPTSTEADEKPLAAPSSESPTVLAKAVPSTTPPPPELSAKAAGKAAVRSPSPPPLPPKDERFLASNNGVSSRGTSPTSQDRSKERSSDEIAEAEYGTKYDGADEADENRSEIQSIMEQFEGGDGGLPADEIMSPRMEFAGPLLESPVKHPPRRSSLVPLDKPLPTPSDSASPEQGVQSPPPRKSSLYRVGTNSSMKEPMSPSAHAPQYKPTPPVPQPDPEPDLPFDFHRFLDQLRHRTADPVAKFLRSFLLEFGKRQWMVHEQVKIVSDFLEFIAKKMAQCEVWQTVSDAEFDNAREGMEKLVMSRLYNYTFSPAIPPPEPVHPTRGKRRGEPLGPGRRGQHQEDVERDEVLAQKVRIYKWIREEHLDIEPVGEKGRRFLLAAQQELLKITTYRAPRDKVICILNCCKVIFGFLRSSDSDQSADAFVPLLIYTVLQANPDHLVSNVQYILRFRNQDKLGGEAGYYISSLMGAIQFIEGLDRTSLTVTDEEFEKNVEAAVSAIAEKHPQPQPAAPEQPNTPTLRVDTARTPSTGGSHRRMPSPHLLVSEKSTLARPEVTPRNSLDAERAGPLRASNYRKSEGSDAPEEENAAVAGLLRTIQKPLSSIGRIFSDNDAVPSASSTRSTPQPTRSASEYPASEKRQQQQQQQQARISAEEQRRIERIGAEDAAARQASAEAEQARMIQRREHVNTVETLQGMFPALDREVIEDVVRLNEGR